MRVCLGVLAPVLLVLSACNELPSPRVVETDGGVVVEVKRLGEYPSALRRIRLTRTRDAEVVFEVAYSGAEPLETWGIHLQEGWNDLSRWHHSHQQVLSPAGGRFWLEAGEEYRVDFWGTADWKLRSVKFAMPRSSFQEDIEAPTASSDFALFDVRRETRDPVRSAAVQDGWRSREHL